MSVLWLCVCVFMCVWVCMHVCVRVCVCVCVCAVCVVCVFVCLCSALMFLHCQQSVPCTLVYYRVHIIEM